MQMKQRNLHRQAGFFLAFALALSAFGSVETQGIVKGGDACGDSPCRVFLAAGGGEPVEWGETNPFDLLQIKIRIFRPTIEEPVPEDTYNVFYQNDSILAEITVTNNAPSEHSYDVSYMLFAVEGGFQSIEESTPLTVAPGTSEFFFKTFDLPGNVPAGTYMVTVTAQETPGTLEKTASVLLTVLMGTSGGSTLDIDETSFFLLPAIGFAALFLLRKGNARKKGLSHAR